MPDSSAANAAASPASYAAFLSFLLGFGPKLQAGWSIIQAWINATVAVVEWAKSLAPNAAPQPQPGDLSAFSLTADEERMEGELGELIAGPNAAFDGEILRKAWAFFQAHPELLTLLLSFAKGG